MTAFLHCFVVFFPSLFWGSLHPTIWISTMNLLTQIKWKSVDSWSVRTWHVWDPSYLIPCYYSFIYAGLSCVPCYTQLKIISLLYLIILWGKEIQKWGWSGRLTPTQKRASETDCTLLGVEMQNNQPSLSNVLSDKTKEETSFELKCNRKTSNRNCCLKP